MVARCGEAVDPMVAHVIDGACHECQLRGSRSSIHILRGHVPCNERPSPTLLSTIKGQTCSKWPPRRPPEMYRRLAAFRCAGHDSSHIPSVLPSFHLAPDNLPRLKPKNTILFDLFRHTSVHRSYDYRQLYARNYTASRIKTEFRLLVNPR